MRSVFGVFVVAMGLALMALGCPARVAADPPVRFLALGDSFTIGTGSRPDQSFPARLVARWSARGCAVALRNLGFNGYTTQDLLDQELPAAQGYDPAVVTLAIGANDLVRGRTPAVYRAQLRRIFAGIIAAGIPPRRVIAVPQPDWSRSPAAADFGDPAVIGAQIAGFNTILREESTAAGARYIDLGALMARQAAAAMVASDGLHPSTAAYDAWADALARALPIPCTRPPVH